MKPSLEEVLQKILEHYALVGKNKFIKVDAITEELDTCYENVLPSLLQLSREHLIRFADDRREAVSVVAKNIAA